MVIILEVAIFHSKNEEFFHEKKKALTRIMTILQLNL